MNFEGADLSKLDLGHINFKFANLSRCNLSQCDLQHCNFIGANMRVMQWKHNTVALRRPKAASDYAGYQRCNSQPVHF